MKILGLDIGGSSIKGAKFIDNKLVGRYSVKTMEHPALKKDVFARLSLAIEMLGTEDIDAIGIASTGDISNGVVIKSNNLQGMDGMPLAAMTENKYKIPSFLCNDAVAAAISETAFYPEYKDIFLMTFGTGIGCAHKVGNSIRHLAKEDYGHRILDPSGPLCQCGKHGCAKAYLSAKVIGRQTIEDYGRSLAPSALMKLFLEKDEKAVRIIDQYATHLNILLRMVLEEINPEILILGGGLMEAQEVMDQIITIDKNRYRYARLGNSAGVIGAKMFAEASIKRRK